MTALGLTKTTRFNVIVLIFIGLSLTLRAISHDAIDLLPEEAYYWNYAQHLDFGYLDHPPMVALLIKLTTYLGTNELCVRLSSLFCWLLTAFFSFKLTQRLMPGAGLYSVFLLSILPYFFVESLIITPDQPLLACWAASLYVLYRALILKEAPYWYLAGISLGLGMLSKYSIAILGISTLLYILMTPSSRHWLCRKEPYLGMLITCLLFSPVIYWNAKHDWISFVFQSTHRLQATPIFTLHHLVGLFILFLMPPGLLGFWTLFTRQRLPMKHSIPAESKHFLQIFTLVPLIIFGAFSVRHDIKFNWIGPGLLALIPWLALLIHENSPHTRWNLRQSWFITAILLIPGYSFILWIITFGTPAMVYDTFFIKFISWENLTQQIQLIAHQVEVKTQSLPIIIPLDHYFIGSEFSFYQAKNSPMTHYPIVGRHVFGEDSLMYQFWSKREGISGKYVILLSMDPNDFTALSVTSRVALQSPTHDIISHSQGQGTPSSLFYYQVVRMKPYAISNAYKSHN
ncbi:MAG: glycosyltransferase family 39 protein [Legionellales bacterium]|nr:glycosyltransferase family 39 protein [Legionellales bacterium]